LGAQRSKHALMQDVVAGMPPDRDLPNSMVLRIVQFYHRPKQADLGSSC